MVKRLKNLKKSLLIPALLIFGGIIYSAACEEKRTPSRFLIPKDYVGWVQIDYEVKDAPPVTLEDGRFFFKFPSSGRIQTASKHEFGWAGDDYYFYSGENREEIKVTSSGNGGLIWGGGTGSNSSSANLWHAFVGTEEQFKKCGVGNEQKIGALDAETLKKCLGK